MAALAAPTRSTGRSVARFQGVRALTLFFPSNFGADRTQIHFIELRGECRPVRHVQPQQPSALRPADVLTRRARPVGAAQQIKRDAVVTLYELNANPADHDISQRPSLHPGAAVD